MIIYFDNIRYYTEDGYAVRGKGAKIIAPFKSMTCTSENGVHMVNIYIDLPACENVQIRFRDKDKFEAFVNKFWEDNDFSGHKNYKINCDKFHEMLPEDEDIK